MASTIIAQKKITGAGFSDAGDVCSCKLLFSTSMRLSSHLRCRTTSFFRQASPSVRVSHTCPPQAPTTTRTCCPGAASMQGPTTSKTPRHTCACSTTGAARRGQLGCKFATASANAACAFSAAQWSGNR